MDKKLVITNKIIKDFNSYQIEWRCFIRKTVVIKSIEN